jgi:26S proteasome non-ATPase regulatory subunit 9
MYDLVLKFGDLTINNATSPFHSFAELVPAAAGNNESIAVTVRRSGQATATVQLTPRPWNGRGLVGCHIEPYTNDE